MKLSMSRTKSFRIARIGVALAVFAGPVWAQELKPEHVRYTVTDLGALQGGPFSQATGISNNDFVSGFSILPDGTTHAFLWTRETGMQDIGIPGLGGPNANSGAYGVNERGQASGGAEITPSTQNLDPNGEDFCGYGTHLICLAFLWHNGVMTPLPTLGGNNGEAGQINNRGEIAGNAENSTMDSTSPTPKVQVLQEKPVIWRNGEIKELDTFRGDPDGWAFGINDNGQVVGASGICSILNQDTVVYILSRHALLWGNGTVTDLGSLGGNGTFGPGNVALELNNQSQVVGASDLKPSDMQASDPEVDTNYHAFLWTRETGMQDLHTLPGVGTPLPDADSVGLGINDQGQVVGTSFDASGNPRAFLWQDGAMIDLNTVIPTDSPLYLLFAHGINSRGEIIGFGADSTGDIHAFLATPCDYNHADNDLRKGNLEGAVAEGDAITERPRPVLSENVRRLLQQYMWRHYHIGGSQ
jgi:probable HAF family extracellular repeat protein